jgi:hypothetical protein
MMDLARQTTRVLRAANEAGINPQSSRRRLEAL